MLFGIDDDTFRTVRPNQKLGESCLNNVEVCRWQNSMLLRQQPFMTASDVETGNRVQISLSMRFPFAGSLWFASKYARAPLDASSDDNYSNIANSTSEWTPRQVLHRIKAKSSKRALFGQHCSLFLLILVASLGHPVTVVRSLAPTYEGSEAVPKLASSSFTNRPSSASRIIHTNSYTFRISCHSITRIQTKSISIASILSF